MLKLALQFLLTPFRTQRSLALENIALRHHIEVLQRNSCHLFTGENNQAESTDVMRQDDAPEDEFFVWIGYLAGAGAASSTTTSPAQVTG
jgi:hypothetical protein